jgi:hypothetical protein
MNVVQRFDAQLASDDFPCIGAKAAKSKRSMVTQNLTMVAKARAC